MTAKRTVGVLAVQGDYEAHEKQIKRVAARPVEIRLPKQLDEIDSLIIPGGESTTMNIMIDRFDLREPLKEFGRTKPIFGTCAGMIMLATRIENNISNVKPLGLLDIKVDRNGYGRQVHSSQEQITAELDGTPTVLTVAFIRAPRVLAAGPEVKVMATWRDDPVLVRCGNILAAAFHAELGDDTALLEYFLGHVQ